MERLIKLLRDKTGLSVKECRNIAVYALENHGHLSVKEQIERGVDYHHMRMRTRPTSLPEHIHVISELQKQRWQFNDSLETSVVWCDHIESLIQNGSQSEAKNAVATLKDNLQKLLDGGK